MENQTKEVQRQNAFLTPISIKPNNPCIFVKEEYELADQLKQMCDSKGNEQDPKKSAEIFHKLGLIYFNRNTMVSLIRSATLFNAAITRQPDNVRKISEALKVLCAHVLKEAGASKLDADLIEAAKLVKKAVATLRSKVNKVLNNLKRLKTTDISEEKLEDTKIENIKNLQNMIAADYTKIVSNLLLYCINVMGNPPCFFALVGMGSLARKEITPYSDFEHIIVLEENAQQRPDYNKILNYFRWLSVIFQIVLINLQETIIPSVDIESLKTKDSKKSWFYDNITKRGICFDGMMPHACKFPLGQQVLFEKQNNSTELIKPVDEMLEYLTSSVDLKSGYHLKDILTKVCYVGGNKAIFYKFQNKIHNLIDQQDKEENRKETRKMLIEDLDNFATRSNFLNLISNSFNIKRDLYRSTSIFISALGKLENIHASSSFDILEALARQKKISNKLKRKLMYAIALACEFRLKRYMKQKRQDDDIKEAKSRQEAVRILTDGIEIANLISYFQIAYALQCHVSKQFDLKKVHFYSDPKLLNCKLYYCFGSYQKFIHFFNQNRAIKQKLKFRLKSAEEILDTLEEEANSHHDQSTLLASNQTNLFEDQNLNNICNFGSQLHNTGIEDDAKDIFEILIEVITLAAAKAKQEIDRCSITVQKPNGTKKISNREKLLIQTLDECASCCLQTNKPVDAIKYLQQSLEIKKEKSLDILSDTYIAMTLNNIGLCYMNMHKPADAMKYLQQSLEIDEKVSIDKSMDTNLAKTLTNIGLCFKDMHKPSDAMNYLLRSLEIHDNASLNDFPDTNVAETLNNIGLCFMDMHKPDDALDYLEQSLKIYENSSLDIFLESNLAKTLNNIGLCFKAMHKPVVAMDYLQRSLEIDERTSLDISSDTNLAKTLNNLGLCLKDQHKPAEALRYFERSLEIDKKISLGVSTDTDLAKTINNIGLCFMDMHKPAEAIDYLQRSLEIDERVSIDISLDINVAKASNNIGLCLMAMHKLTDAMTYLQRAMKIDEKTSVDISSDTNLAKTFNNIGLCFKAVQKPIDAMKYLQRSLDIFEKTSLDRSLDCNLAKTLNNIGLCLMTLNKNSEALDYLQQSLEIDERTSSNISNDTSVAKTLNNIGLCFKAMCKPEKAIYYLQQSLKIVEKLSFDISSDSNLSKTLNNIGLCLMDLHKPEDAMDYLKRSLEIDEKTSISVSLDKNVAKTLNNIGLCFKDMQKQSEAMDYLQRSQKIKQNSLRA